MGLRKVRNFWTQNEDAARAYLWALYSLEAKSKSDSELGRSEDYASLRKLTKFSLKSSVRDWEANYQLPIGLRSQKSEQTNLGIKELFLQYQEEIQSFFESSVDWEGAAFKIFWGEP